MRCCVDCGGLLRGRESPRCQACEAYEPTCPTCSQPVRPKVLYALPEKAQAAIRGRSAADEPGEPPAAS